MVGWVLPPPILYAFVPKIERGDTGAHHAYTSPGMLYPMPPFEPSFSEWRSDCNSSPPTCDMYPLDSQRHVVHPSLIMTGLQGVGHHFHGEG